MDYKRSKLGLMLDARGLTLIKFAEMVYKKTGYLIAISNVSAYCTGYKKLTKISILEKFAITLDCKIEDLYG